jgi:hypothetical protein
MYEPGGFCNKIPYKGWEFAIKQLTSGNLNLQITYGVVYTFNPFIDNKKSNKVHNTGMKEPKTKNKRKEPIEK